MSTEENRQAPAGETTASAPLDPGFAEDRRQQPKPKKTQTMKPETAAKKLGILLAAAPEVFTASPITRDQLNSLLAEPPTWLTELRATGPHPRPVVAAKLGVSTSGLARAGMTEPLSTAEIKELLETKPQWLVTERAIQHEVREEQIRVRDAQAGKEALRAETER